MKDGVSGPTSPPGTDTGNRGYCLRCIPTTVTVTSQYNKYVTGSDVSMPLTGETTSGERVVPTTQIRLTGVGGSQHMDIHFYFVWKDTDNENENENHSILV